MNAPSRHPIRTSGHPSYPTVRRHKSTPADRMIDFLIGASFVIVVALMLVCWWS